MNNDEAVKKSIGQEIAKATVSILVDGKPKGTGFFITPDGYVLTAYHCIGVCPPEVRVKTFSGEHFIARLDEEKTLVPHDIAVLKVDACPSLCLPLGVVSSQHVSDEVISLGYPGSDRHDNQQLGFYPGKIFRFRDDGKIETDAVRGGGQSGGLLYHYDTKRVVGVVKEHYWSKEVQQLSENKLVTAPPKVLAGLAVQLEPLFARWSELESITGQVAKEWEANPAVAALSYRSIPSNIPFSGAKEFVGREPELDTLHEQFQTTSRLVISAIAGMGGIGKTELAIQYALLHKADYMGGICWLPASAQDLNLGIQITEFAKSRLNLQFPDDLKKVEDQVGFCWQHWPLGEVLVVLDNVTHYEEVKSYLPSAAESRFKVLITTRQQMGQPIKQLDLDVLDEAASLALLEAHLGKERLQAELEVAKKLCAWLGFLPLGLELVGRYLAVKEDLSLAQMQQRLEKKRLQQVALVEPKPEMTAQRGVATAFELSWEELDEKAQQLGCLLSLFAPAPIRWELAEQVLSKQDPEDLETVRDEQLRQLHLLQRKGQGIYQLHTLVREFLRVKLEESPWAKELKQAFANTIANLTKQLFWESPKKELFDNLVTDIFHLEEVAQNLTAELSAEDLVGPFIGITTFYLFRVLPARAEPWCQQWLSVAEKCFKGNDLLFSKVFAQFFLGVLYHIQNKLTQAESCFYEMDKIFSVLKKENPNDPVIEFLKMSFLSTISPLRGQYGELESLTAQLKSMLSGFGENNPIIFQNLCNLANSYAEQGRFEEAESTLQQALKVFQNSPDSLYAPQGLVALSEVYFKQKRYSEAENLLRQSLEVSRRVIGDNNAHVAGTIAKLGSVCQLQNRYEEAEVYYKQALEWCKISASNNPDLVENQTIRKATAFRLQDLAGLYFIQKRFHDAEPLYVQILEIFEDLWGEGYLENEHMVVDNLTKLVNIYYVQDEHDKAVDFYGKAIDHLLQTSIARKQPLDKALDDLEESLNSSTSSILSVLTNITKNFTQVLKGETGETDDFYLFQQKIQQEKILEAKKRLLGDNHLSFAQTLDKLASNYAEQNQHEKAESLYMQSLAIRKHLLGDNHLEVASTLTHLASNYLRWNQYDKAESLCIQALAIRRYLLGDIHIEVANNLRELADLYMKLSRNGEAEPLYLQYLDIQKRLNYPSAVDISSVSNVFSRLIFIYTALEPKRLKEAESLCMQRMEIHESALAKEFQNVLALDITGNSSPLAFTIHVDAMIGSFSQLAAIYQSQSRLEEAKSVLKKAFLFIENLQEREYFLVDSIFVINSIFMLVGIANGLGLFYQNHGRYLEAENLYQSCLELVETQKCLQGKEHANVGIVLNNFGTLCRDQKHYKEAEPLFLRSLEICRKCLNNNDPNLARIMDNLGMVYSAQGRYSEAKSLYKQALAIFEKMLKADEPRLLRCRNNLKALPATTKEPNIFQKLRLLVFRK